jgi:hypothetical protein
VVGEGDVGERGGGDEGQDGEPNFSGEFWYLGLCAVPVATVLRVPCDG